MQNDMWERADFSVFDEYIFRDEIHKIGKALEEGEEAVVEAELQKRETLFTEDEAHKLCSVAIQNGCSKRIFSALLEKCPPLETFRFRFSCDFVYAARVDLAGYAAMFDRGKLLEVMLEQGLELKKQNGWCTVLEAALEAASIDCVMLLLHQEEIEIPITKELCYIWGNVGMAYGSDICYAAVASKIFGYEVDLNVEEVPLLPNMKVYQAVACYNWPLFRRICREIGKDALESRGIGHLLGTILKESDDPMEDMDILLSLHPKALKNELVRYCLVVSALRAKDAVDERLKKWLNQMPGGMVVMNVSRVFEEEDGMNLQTLILLRWQERIGTRLIPALSRDKPFPEMNGIFLDGWDGIIRTAMKLYRVKGGGKKGWISELAAHLLRVASPTVVGEMLEAGFVLDKEDPVSMLCYCKWNEEYQKRYLVAAYLNKEDAYAL